MNKPFCEWMVDVAFYAQCSFLREAFGDVSDVGETYRKRMRDPQLVLLIDRWARDFLARVEQTDDPRATWKKSNDFFVAGMLNLLTPQEKQDFADRLECEKQSPRFAAEIRKFHKGPYFQLLDLLFSPRSNCVPAEDAGRIVEKSFLERIAASEAPDAWRDEGRQPILDETVRTIGFLPAALHKMSREIKASDIAEEHWPWKVQHDVFTGKSPQLASGAPLLIRALLAEGLKKAEEKRRWQEERQEEKREGDKDPDALLLDDEQASVVVQFKDIAETALARVTIAKKRNEIEEAIRRTYRKQRAKHYLRLFKLYCASGGDLPQNEETAKQAGVSLRTVKTFFADARRLDWIKN